MKRSLLTGFLALCLGLFPLSGAGQTLDDVLDNQKTPPTAAATPSPASPDESTGQPETPPALSPVEAKRAEIVNRAREMVGQVSALPGPDGFKQGWQHLLEFYQLAYRLNNIETDRPEWVPSLKAPNRFIDGKNWSWCGIFCAWAWRKSCLDVWWDGNLKNAKWRGDWKNLGPGDIVALSRKVNPNDHHCLVMTRDGNKLTTINGNGNNQGISIKNNTISDLIGFYSVADLVEKQIAPPPTYPPGAHSALPPVVTPTPSPTSPSATTPSPTPVAPTPRPAAGQTPPSPTAAPQISQAELDAWKDFLQKLSEFFTSTIRFPF